VAFLGGCFQLLRIKFRARPLEQLPDTYLPLLASESGGNRLRHTMTPPSNMRMKLAWRGGRSKGNVSVLMAAAAPRSLCAIR